MKTVKAIFFLFMVLGSFHLAFSQNNADSNNTKIEVNAGADLYSRYIWRGSQFGGNAPSLQPSLSATYGNLEIGAWGAYSIGGLNPAQEADLYLTYTFAKDLFSIVFTDYFFPEEGSDYNYFEYNADKTGHIFEGGLSFNGTSKIPVTFSAFVNLYGADAPTLGSNISDTMTFNKPVDIQYSNYFELGYNMSVKNTDINLFMGFTLNNPKKTDATTGFIGETGFYGTSPGVVNLGITCVKSVKITTDFQLPMTVSFITNPQAEKVYLIFGISF
jgi:hypothetical protein